MTLYSHNPCEHGEDVAHSIGVDVFSRVKWCPGGSVIPVTINYEAALTELAENGITLDIIGIQAVLDAALSTPQAAHTP